MRTTEPNNWTAAWKARRSQELAEPEAPAESFNELRARAKAAGVSAAGTRADIEARLEEQG